MEAAAKRGRAGACHSSSGAASFSRGKSTGLPIEDEQQVAGEHLLAAEQQQKQQKQQQQGEQEEAPKKRVGEKRLAQLFNRSTSTLLTKSSKFLDSLHLGQQLQLRAGGLAPARSKQSELEEKSAAELLSSSSLSSDEWQLLSPTDCEDEDEAGQCGAGEQQKMQQVDSKSASVSNDNNNNNSHDDELSVRNNNYVTVEARTGARSRALVHLCASLYALVPLASFGCLLALLGLLASRFWPLALAYFGYLLLDRDTCNRGGRRLELVHKSPFWSHLAAYFPVRLRYSRQMRLEPNENYILNYHPHGIAAFGCVASFATNALNFSHLFPGLTARFMVHETSFLVPLMREIFQLRGDCSVSSRSFDHLLEKRWREPSAPGASGNLLALVGGGLAEADLSHAERLKIVVASRKGFVRKALLHGAHLIPCIAFGENSVFTKINFEPNSLLHRLESAWYRLFKFKHPLYYGRSIFSASPKLRGALPYSRPITVVMGEPIRVERAPEPTQQQVDELHARYLRQLQQLYANNQDLCTIFDRRLELV